MNSHNLSQHIHETDHEKKNHQLPNSLRIERIEFIRNQARKQLILLVETEEMITPDINISVKGSRLVIEAMKDLNYDQPYYLHLLGKDGLTEFSGGGMQVGFSEIKLKGHHQYMLAGYDVINPHLLKIILMYDANAKNNIFYN